MERAGEFCEKRFAITYPFHIRLRFVHRSSPKLVSTDLDSDLSISSSNSKFTSFQCVQTATAPKMNAHDYYEPLQLFRANAFRRSMSPTDPCPSSPLSNQMSFTDSAASSDDLIEMYESFNRLKKYNNSWLLNNENDSDLENVTKACSMGQTNIMSNYWKIPDDDFYLTSLSVNNDSPDKNPLLAISSGNHESNLFIYEINPNENYLTHHTTISLPNISTMKWLNHTNKLVTGNRKGYAHLVLVPEVGDSQPAEILKRFNHSKHLEQFKNASATELASVDHIIKKIHLTPSSWNSTNDNSMLSLYQEYIYLWDIERSRAPVLKCLNRGIKDFHPSPTSDGILAISGDFGVVIQDLRINPCEKISRFAPTGATMTGKSNLIKWAPHDGNTLATAHDDSVVRLWDIRMQDCFSELKGHTDDITSIEWSEFDNNDLYTGSKDGTIVHWDLTTEHIGNDADTRPLTTCVLKQGLNSVVRDIDNIVNERQCGTIIPASTHPVIDMVTLNSMGGDCKVLSIDGSSFLGIHSKLSNDNITEKYYNSLTLQEMMQQEKDKETKNMEMYQASENKDSNDTLIASPKLLAQGLKNISVRVSDRSNSSASSNHSDSDTIILSDVSSGASSPDQMEKYDDFQFNNELAQDILRSLSIYSLDRGMKGLKPRSLHQTHQSLQIPANATTGRWLE